MWTVLVSRSCQIFVQLENPRETEMNRKREDSMITLDTTGVEIEQHEGLWHTVDKMEIENEIFLFDASQ